MNREATHRHSPLARTADEDRWIERIRPGLGTLVRIGIGGLPLVEAERSIERGFEAIATAHRTLGFHDPGSDLSVLNRLPVGQSLTVGHMLNEVLRIAQALAAETGGEFDVTVADALVAEGLLPPIERRVEPGASWRDLQWDTDGTVRWTRAGLIDLGGIAKGYAIDRAVVAMHLPAAASWRVEAGGDLRVGGVEPERIVLAVPDHPLDTQPCIELQNASLASSAVDRERPVHRRGVDRSPIDEVGFAAVVARECVIADALTKVVLACGANADAVLQRYAATGYLYSARSGWRTLGAIRSGAIL
jgi:thiamine biosynthesis lipoprotein